MQRMIGNIGSWQWIVVAVVCGAAALAVGQVSGKMPLPREGTDLPSGPGTPAGLPATPPSTQPSTLVVHEWGVWVRGGNPGAGGGYTLGPPGQLNAQLPPWVIKRNLPMTAPQPVPPPNVVPQQWNKPVIHFYQGEGLEVKVSVTIAKGWPTAYWPPAAVAASPLPRAQGGPPPAGFAPGAIVAGQLPMRVGVNTLTWSGKLSADAPTAENAGGAPAPGLAPGLPPPAAAPVPAPGANPAGGPMPKAHFLTARTLRDVPADHWWSAIRKVPGLYLTTPSGSERFIFYEGTAAQDPILKATVSGETLTVQNTSTTTTSGPLLVILNDGQKLHWVSASDIAAGAEMKWTRADVEKGQTDAAKLLEFSRSQWETFGLTKEEAAAVVEVWKADLTGHIGLLVVGKMPRDVYDQMFPLEVTPKPAQIVRVGVVFDALPGQADRTQWLPGLAAQLQQWGKELDDDKYEVRAAAGKKFVQAGELAVPYLKKLAETGSAEVQNAARRLLKEIEQQEQAATTVSPPVMHPPIRIGPIVPMPLPAPVPAPIQ